MEDRLSDDDVLADLEVAAVGMLEELSTDENGEARLFNNSNSRAGRRRNAPASPGAFVDVTSAQTTPSGFKSKRKKQDEVLIISLTFTTLFDNLTIIKLHNN